MLKQLLLYERTKPIAFPYFFIKQHLPIEVLVEGVGTFFLMNYPIERNPFL